MFTVPTGFTVFTEALTRGFKSSGQTNNDRQTNTPCHFGCDKAYW